jgi:hypothetical protein
MEIDPSADFTPTGREHCVEIIYMLTGEQWGLHRYYSALGIK